MPVVVTQILNSIENVPQYCLDFFNKHQLYTVIGLIIFLVVLLFSNKVTHILRELIVLAAVVAGVIGYFTKTYEQMWVSVFVILIIGIFRFLRYLIVTVRQNKIDAKINERALAKAAKRRGSWEEKKGYSGDAKPEDEDDVPAEMTDEELDDVVENETQGHEGASIDTSSADAVNDKMADKPDDDGYLSRTAAERALGELKDLRTLGILTEEEYSRKKSEIYSRLG